MTRRSPVCMQRSRSSRTTRMCCSISDARLLGDLEGRLTDGRSVIEPFQLLCLPTQAADQLRCARNYVSGKTRALQIPSVNFGPRDRDKLRVAYLSADFRVHPVAMLIAE